MCSFAMNTKLQPSWELLGLLGIVVWVAYYSLVMPWLWNLVSQLDLVGWMSERTDTTEGFYRLAFVLDLVINFVLAAPVAFLFALLVKKPWTFVIAGALLGSLWSYRLVLTDYEMMLFFVTSFPAAGGVFISLIVLPLGVLLFNQLIRGAT